MGFGSFRRHPIYMKPMLSRPLHFFNLCLALFLLSACSSCFRTLLFHSFTLFASLFNHTFYVFLLQNLLIFLIFSLSHRNQLFHRNPHPRLHATAAPGTPHHPSPPLPQTFFPQLVDQSPVPALDKTPKATRSLTTVSRNNVSGNIDCYRRVRSDNFSGRIVVGGSPELNGFNAVARYGGEPGRRFCSVDQLSKEDFNRTVEEYIAMQKRMLRQELAE
ncbi:hypothetical protein K1719_015893 [Acacia pycnantha]|nr:hypothetical protein K1719_015893 [Acacia pycnantha]